LGFVLGRAGHEVRQAGLPASPPVSGPLRLRLVDAASPPGTPLRAAHEVLPVKADYAPELVFVSVPHVLLPTALNTVAQIRRGAPVVLFSDLWQEEHAPDQALPRRQYLWAYPAVAGSWTEDGWLEGVVMRRVGLNTSDGLQTPLLAMAVDLFRNAGLRPAVQPDVIPWLRTRFAIEAALAGAACAAGGSDRLLQDVPALARAVQGARDALRVVERTGVDVTAFAEARSLSAPSAASVRVLRAALRIDHLTRRFIELRIGRDQMPVMLSDVLDTARRLQVEVPHLRELAACLVPPRPA